MNFNSSDLAELKNNLQDLKSEQDDSNNIFNEIFKNLLKLRFQIPENKSRDRNSTNKSKDDNTKQKTTDTVNNCPDLNSNKMNFNITEDQTKKCQSAIPQETQYCYQPQQNQQQQDFEKSIKKQQLAYQIESKFAFIFNYEYYTAQFSRCTWEQEESILVILSNISEQKRNLYLEQINCYKDKLLASVSHDLKTPLNCILSVIDYLISINSQKDFEGNLKLIQNNTQMLLYMINDILDYSKSKNKQLSLNISSFWLSSVIQEVKQLFSIQVQSQNIEFLENLSNNNDILIYNDKNRLKQILINLISNALKFTRQGSVKILAEKMEDGNINISVQDTGVGMSDYVKKQLFQDYSTFDNQHHMNTQGVGLGLVICQKLIGLIGKGNSINVDSTLGKGSCFSFILITNYAEQSQNASESVEYSVQFTDNLISDSRTTAYKSFQRKKSKFSNADNNTQNNENASTDIQIASEQSEEQKKTQQQSFKILERNLNSQSINSTKRIQKEFDEESKYNANIHQVFNDLDNQFSSSRKLLKDDPQTKFMLKKTVSENNTISHKQYDQTNQLNQEHTPVSSPIIFKNNSQNKYKKQTSLSNKIFHLVDQQQQETNCVKRVSITNEQKIHKIMIVDDSQYNIIAIKLQLREFKNFEIEEYLFSEAALERVKSKEVFDIIFCDMNMPFMNGYQLISEIRKLKDSIIQPKIVIVSADNLIYEQNKFQKYDVSLFLTKPILEKSKFCQKVQKLLLQ